MAASGIGHLGISILPKHQEELGIDLGLEKESTMESPCPERAIGSPCGLMLELAVSKEPGHAIVDNMQAQKDRQADMAAKACSQELNQGTYLCPSGISGQVQVVLLDKDGRDRLLPWMAYKPENALKFLLRMQSLSTLVAGSLQAYRTHPLCCYWVILWEGGIDHTHQFRELIIGLQAAQQPTEFMIIGMLCKTLLSLQNLLGP